MGMDTSNMGREDRSKGPEVEVYLAIQTYYLKKNTQETRSFRQEGKGRGEKPFRSITRKQLFPVWVGP